MSITKNIFAPWASGLGATRRAAMLLLVMMLTMTAQTAWAEDVVTYTISHRTEDGRYIYYLNGSDGSSQVVLDAKWVRPTSVTLEMGSDVTFNITAKDGNVFTCNYNTKAEDISMFGFSDYFNTNEYAFTFTSKSRNISHIQIDGKGYVKYLKAKTTLEVDNSGKTCTVNWEGGSGGNRKGAPGKFIVTFTAPVTYYAINYVLNGGTNASGNPTTYADNVGVASFATPTRDGYTFAGWYGNASFTGAAVTSIAAGTQGDVTLYAKWTPNPTHFSQSGNTYTIHTAGGWNVFCDLLAENDKGYFSGKTVKLGNNITVSRMAGSSGQEFTGMFNGNGKTLTVDYANTDNNVGTAPFSYVDGATIQNLIVGGSISGTAYRAAGIIGETGANKSYIANCVSNVDISSGRYTGGFSIGGNVEIEGCVFSGKINGTDRSGGFIGYSYSAQVIKNSLFAPQDGSSISGGTFYYNGGGDVDPVNSYYTQALGTAQGKACHSVTAGENVTIDAIALTGDATEYNVSGITAYSGGGLKCGNVKYYDSGDQVSLTLSNTTTGAPEGYTNGGYTASAGTLSGTENPYTLTMPDEDVTITVTLKKLMTNNDITVTIEPQTWTGNELTPVITVKDGETVLTENTDYTVTAPSGTIQDSGDYIFTITGMGNYAGSREAMFTITPFLADQFGAVYVYQDQNGKTAFLDGTSVEPVDIPSVINKTVNHVTSNRTFTPGKASTVMLPFNYTCNGEEGGTFYKFVGVKQVNDKWVATMQETGKDANNEGALIANTPYLFMPTATGMSFPNINGSVTLSTEGGGNCETADPGSHWTFKGTYWFKEWNSDDYYYTAEEIGRAYGFAGVAQTDINVGDFVRVASGAKIRPMGCYLLWDTSLNFARALTRGAAAEDVELPQRITVKLVSASGETTGIGTINTKTGEMTFDSEAWYTLDGVRLSGKPTKKGLYINNGRKVVIEF